MKSEMEYVLRTVYHVSHFIIVDKFLFKQLLYLPVFGEENEKRKQYFERKKWERN